VPGFIWTIPPDRPFNMNKILIYDSNNRYLITDSLAIYPNDAVPIEEIDLSDPTPEQIKEIKDSLHDKKLMRQSLKKIDHSIKL